MLSCYLHYKYNNYVEKVCFRYINKKQDFNRYTKLALNCSIILKKNNSKIRHMEFLAIVGIFFFDTLFLTLLQLKRKKEINNKNVVALLYSKCSHYSLEICIECVKFELSDK